MTNKGNWLTELVLEAACQFSRDNLNVLTTIKSDQGVYEVLEKIGGSDRFNLYKCLLPAAEGFSSKIGILKISVDKNDGGLDKESLILRRLQSTARKIDLQRNLDSPAYNYGFFVPDIIDTFICADQDNRRINVIGFCEEIKNTSQLTSLSEDKFSEEKIRIDGKTSVWILGKLLKIIGFSHQNGVTNEMINGSNILIEKEKHGLILFDWTKAVVSDNISSEDTRREIVCAAQVITTVLGGDAQTGTLPDDQEKWYQSLIQRLVRGEFDDAFVAHSVFYKTIFEHWPKTFYPFTTLPN